MPLTEHIEQVYIELTQGDIMGSYSHLQTKYMDNLLSVEVDDSLDWPDMFVIRLLDPGLELLQADLFKLGTKIKLSVRKSATPGSQDQPQQKELMRGEVTSIEPELSTVERSVLVVRGYDLSHKMNRVKNTTTFLQMSDSDIAQKLAQGSALLSSVESTNIIYPYLMQANQTDWEFLMERARRIGYRLYVEGKTLHFKPPPASPPSAGTLRWGLELGEFRARMSTVDQPSQVTVRGWDPKAKQTIIGQASSPQSSAITRQDNGKYGGNGAQTAHSVQGKIAVYDAPVFSQDEAQKMAQAILSKTASSYVQAEGAAGGDPDILAGSKVSIDGIGSRFGGDYLVVRANHRYSANEYKTHFWVSGGLGSMTITEILRGGNGTGQADGTSGHGDKATARGVMVGIVTSNQDAENLGRVKVKIPALGDVESYWCRMATIMAGPGQGVAYFPEANDEVVVAFQNGDPNHGYVLGAVWNGNDKLPKPLGQLVTGGTTIRRVIKSRVGHEITLDDSPDPTEGIIIQDKTAKNFIKIITKKNKIEIQADADIQVTSNTGKIIVTSNGNTEVTSQTGKITLSSMGDIELTSSTGQVKVTGSTGVNVNSGTGVSVVAGTTLSLTAAASASVSAPMVNLG